MTNGNDVVTSVMRYLGTPYSEGPQIGSGPGAQLDCSGMVQLALADLGISVGRTTYDQVNQGASVASLADARPGDVIFYNNGSGQQPGHEAVYLGGGQIFDEAHSGTVAGNRGPNSATEMPILTIRRFTSPGVISPLGQAVYGPIAPGSPDAIAGIGAPSAALSAESSASAGCAITILGVCVWQNSWTSGLVGGLLVGAGGLVMLTGAAFLAAYGLESSVAHKALGTGAKVVGAPRKMVGGA